MGRPTDCTPEVIARVAEGVRLGMPFAHAARRAGIGESTFYQWKQRGDAGEQPFAEFLEAVESAKAECEAKQLQRIQRAARKGNWQASAWLLERRYPDEYGRRDRHTVDATVSATHDVGANTTDKLAAAFRAAASLTPEERARLRGGGS